MTDNDQQRARRRAQNAALLSRCNVMGRDTPTAQWTPYEKRDGKFYSFSAIEVAAPREWRSEKLSTILDEMDEREAVAPDSGKAYVESHDVDEWKAAVDEQFNEGSARRAVITVVPPTILARSTVSLEELERAISKPSGMVIVGEPSTFKPYRRTNVAEMRPYIPGENIDDVSVSVTDYDAGSPKPGDMIARNPKNHKDQWLVAEQYFKDNFEPV